MAAEPDLFGRPAKGLRERLYRVIWESDTPAGRLFDKIIVAAIVISVIVVIVDSVQVMHARYRLGLDVAEWIFTLLFTVDTSHASPWWTGRCDTSAVSSAS